MNDKMIDALAAWRGEVYVGGRYNNRFEIAGQIAERRRVLLVGAIRNAIMEMTEKDNSWPNKIWVGYEAYRAILRDAEPGGELKAMDTGKTTYCTVAVIPTRSIGLYDFTFDEPKEARP